MLKLEGIREDIVGLEQKICKFRTKICLGNFFIPDLITEQIWIKSARLTYLLALPQVPKGLFKSGKLKKGPLSSLIGSIT